MTGGLSMTDFSQPVDATDLTGIAPGPIAAEPTSSAGALIRQAREDAGLHIAALAVSLKVPVKKLEALEQDRFDLLPDAVFVRALASSVCRTLKIDAATVLDRLPQTAAPKLIYQGAGINAPFRAPGDGPGPTIWAQVSRPAVLAGLAFLLGALVLIFLPAVKPAGLVDKVVAVAMPPGTAQSEVPAAAAMVDEGVKMGSAPGQVLEMPTASPVAPAPAPAMLSAVTSAGGPQPAAAAAVSPAIAVPVLPPVVAAQGSPISAAVAAAGTVAPAQSTSSASGLLTLRAKGESWVEVVDAKGVVVVRRILTAGEVVGVSGALPLTAVVGRADATQVTVRGQPLDLAPIARDNVARFEVK